MPVNVSVSITILGGSAHRRLLPPHEDVQPLQPGLGVVPQLDGLWGGQAQVALQDLQGGQAARPWALR